MYYRSSRLGGRKEAPGVREEPPTADTTTATQDQSQGKQEMRFWGTKENPIQRPGTSFVPGGQEWEVR